MSQATINIGSEVRVTRVRDRIPTALVELLQKDPSGKVVDFRTVDGKGIGVVVELSNGSTCWFFEDEIAACLLYTSPSPRDKRQSRMPSSA